MNLSSCPNSCNECHAATQCVDLGDHSWFCEECLRKALLILEEDRRLDAIRGG